MNLRMAIGADDHTLPHFYLRCSDRARVAPNAGYRVDLVVFGVVEVQRFCAPLVATSRTSIAQLDSINKTSQIVTVVYVSPCDILLYAVSVLPVPSTLVGTAFLGIFDWHSAKCNGRPPGCRSPHRGFGIPEPSRRATYWLPGSEPNRESTLQRRPFFQLNYPARKWRPWPESNRRMRDLQSQAFPLSYTASGTPGRTRTLIDAFRRRTTLLGTGAW